MTTKDELFKAIVSGYFGGGHNFPPNDFDTSRFKINYPTLWNKYKVRPYLYGDGFTYSFIRSDGGIYNEAVANNEQEVIDFLWLESKYGIKGDKSMQTVLDNIEKEKQQIQLKEKMLSSNSAYWVNQEIKTGALNETNKEIIQYNDNVKNTKIENYSKRTQKEENKPMEKPFNKVYIIALIILVVIILMMVRK